jgi:ABC-type sugar transport system ATPase subunit
VLAARDLRKRYGGVTALAGVGLALAPGEVHALLGENGAGKSTVVKVLAGVVTPDAGQLELAGAPVRFAGPRDARRQGVAVVSQELSLFGDLDVLGNLFPTDQPRRYGLLDRRAMARRAAPLLAELGLGPGGDDVDPRAPLDRLPLAQQQLVEICRALLAEPRVLILDEPTSALPAAAARRLTAVIRRITERGVAVLYVSHFLAEAKALADRITVLRDGRNVLTGVPAAGVTIDALVRAMLGTTVRASPAAGPAGGAPAAVRSGPARGGRGARDLRVTDLTVPGELESVSLVARAGEVTGLAGLAGAGHTAVLDALCGRLRPTAGSVRLPDGSPRPASMSAAVRHGVALLPSDRKRLGLMLDATVAENVMSVSWLASRQGGPLLRPAAVRSATRDRIAELRIRGEPDQPVGALSGGNQQKVVFAKWLQADPSLVLLDDPTRGVDVGAKAEMHAIIRRLAAEGRVVLICSTDLAELAAVCDRVIVLRRGRVTGEHRAPDLSEHTLLHAINAATPS